MSYSLKGLQQEEESNHNQRETEHKQITKLVYLH